MSARTAHIDLGLAVISAVTVPGVRWSIDDVAEVCGCCRSYVYYAEREAIRKLRAAAQRLDKPQIRPVRSPVTVTRP